MKIVAAIFFTMTLQAITYAQNTVVQDKIDPVFRGMINAAKERSMGLPRQLPEALRVEPSEGFVSKNALPEKRYDCIVYTKNAQALRDSGIVLNTVVGNFATAWVTLDQMEKISAMPQVTAINAPGINYLHNDIAVGGSGASLLHQGKLNNTIYKGKNVIVAIYDTGIDWDHLDFRDPNDTTKSRILRIWDQTITAGPGEAPPAGFSYGVEYTQTQINDELDGSPANIVRERDINGHGTHVAGTAAGNGASLPSRRYTGMAPEADMIVIKGSNTTFPENRMIDGLTYLKNVATAMGKPTVLNWSIGGQFGPHDGSRAIEVAVDSFCSKPGRVVVISAGNENNTNIHNRVNVAPNGTGSVTINVPDSTASDVFRYRIYANDSSTLNASIASPDGKVLVVPSGSAASMKVLSDSFTVILYNLIDPDNYDRYLEVILYRSDTSARNRPTGAWTLSFTNTTLNNLTMDGWLYYKNTAFNATNVAGGNSDFLVGSPGTSTSAITTASYIGKTSWYNTAGPNSYIYPNLRIDSISGFSSRGPRRDGVLKPDIAAHGEEVASCLSSNATYASYSTVETGLYVVNQGTSMAAPGVTGAAALLLQANPNATAVQIKGFLTAAASKDAMTEINGSSPNASWGFGKLDVFKAASLLFNCLPANRRIYKYDSSTRSAQEVTATLTTSRNALRFTPDISGKLGGVFFYTGTFTAPLVAEVRASNGGIPTTLLGTVNIDSTRIAKYSANYVDLSNLSVSVTSGTDYFIVLARAASSNTIWSLRGDVLDVDFRSLQSSNGGVTWGTLNYDFKIRPVVYSNGQLTGAIATATSTDARNIISSNQFINNNCQLINQVVPGGTNPVGGMITSKVWLETAVPHYLGNPYVQRHYEITPPADASTATGRVTLYFKQAEFDAFNNDEFSLNNLPTGPTDAPGIANLRIGKYSGSSSDNTGSPGSYAAPEPVIDPADGDITWNVAANRWEVSFDVTGFSGFIVQSIPTVLPIIAEYFKGAPENTGNVLNWKINCNSNTAIFDVERSSNGSNFSSIGTLTPGAGSCSQPFIFKDAAPLQGGNYYRIKITGSAGNMLYTNTILLQNGTEIVTRLFPTLISNGTAVQVNFGGVKGTLNVYDALGKLMISRHLSKGVQSLNLGLTGKNIYFYNIKDERGTITTGKLIVE